MCVPTLAAARTIFTVNLFIISFFGGYAYAAKPFPINGDDWVTVGLLTSARGGKTIVGIRETMLQLFQKTDVDGGGISSSDFVIQKQMAQVGSRASEMRRWLNWDLDGDGIVIKGELEALFNVKARKPVRRNRTTIVLDEEQIKSMQLQMVGRAMRLDRDGDGVITFSEALDMANENIKKKENVYPITYIQIRRQIPLSLDADKNGVVSKEEFLQAIDRGLARIDSNNDGKISQAEASLHATKATKTLKKVLEIYTRRRKSLQ